MTRTDVLLLQGVGSRKRVFVESTAAAINVEANYLRLPKTPGSKMAPRTFILKPHASVCSMVLFASSLLLSACTKVVKPDSPLPSSNAIKVLSGGVDSRQITPEDSSRMQLGGNQIFIAGTQTNPDLAPEYPRHLLPLRLPEQTICVSFTVNSDGSVSNIQPIDDVRSCGSALARSEFMVATVEAVSQWDFFSSIRCTFPPGTPDEKKCNGPNSSAEQVPVTLSYRFVFTSRDGVGAVAQSQPGANP